MTTSTSICSCSECFMNELFHDIEEMIMDALLSAPFFVTDSFSDCFEISTL